MTVNEKRCCKADRVCSGYEAIKAARLEHASPEGQQRYQRRAGIVCST